MAPKLKYATSSYFRTGTANANAFNFEVVVAYLTGYFNQMKTISRTVRSDIYIAIQS